MLTGRRIGLGLLAMAAIVAGWPVPGAAQTPLTLSEAMTLARERTTGARVLAAGVEEAAARVPQARGGYFPRLDVSQSVQRGNQPVFVFSSLLSQRRFTPADFAITSLNEPAPLTNVRTALTVGQRVYDGGLTRLGVQAAELGRDLAVTQQNGGAQDLALAAAGAYLRVLQLEAEERAARAAIAAAESDAGRTRARRDAGLVTDADALAMDVHLADMRQRQIAAAGDAAVARIELRDALGLPLDAPVALTMPPAPAVTAADAAGLVAEAVRRRPDRLQADLRVQLAENGRRTAEAAYLPRVGVHGAWEFNGSSWLDQRSAWLIGGQVEMNLFNGFADSARVTERRHGETRAAAEREQVNRRIEVEVRAAMARLNAARAGEDAGRAALAQARESQRIVRDRYDSGLATVTDVLRAAGAALDAESRAATAHLNVVFQAVALDRAVGRL